MCFAHYLLFILYRLFDHKKNDSTLSDTDYKVLESNREQLCTIAANTIVLSLCKDERLLNINPAAAGHNNNLDVDDDNQLLPLENSICWGGAMNS